MEICMRLSSRSLMIGVVLLVSVVLLAPTTPERGKKRDSGPCPQRPVANQMDEWRSLGLRQPLLP
jgi:hypothetical protein